MASAALIPVSPLCEHPEQAHPATPPPPPLPDPPPSHLPSTVAAATPCWYRTTFSALVSLFDFLDYTRVESDPTVLTSFSPAAAPPPAPSLHHGVFTLPKDWLVPLHLMLPAVQLVSVPFLLSVVLLAMCVFCARLGCSVQPFNALPLASIVSTGSNAAMIRRPCPSRGRKMTSEIFLLKHFKRGWCVFLRMGKPSDVSPEMW